MQTEIKTQKTHVRTKGYTLDLLPLRFAPKLRPTMRLAGTNQGYAAVSHWWTLYLEGNELEVLVTLPT